MLLIKYIKLYNSYKYVSNTKVTGINAVKIEMFASHKFIEFSSQVMQQYLLTSTIVKNITYHEHKVLLSSYPVHNKFQREGHRCYDHFGGMLKLIKNITEENPTSTTSRST